MRKPRKTLVSAVVAAILIGLSAGSAHGTQRADNGKESVSAGMAMDENSAPDRDARPAVEASPAANAALAKIQKKIADYVAEHGTRYTFGSYVDSATGKIVLDTDAPPDVVSSVTDLSGASPNEVQMASGEEVHHTTISDDQSHRRDEAPPFYGGGGIGSDGDCSSGYTVRNAAGTRFMVTAGHCFANGTTVTTESGGSTYGIVSNRRLTTVTGNAMDVELIGGQRYSPEIFTGGVDSTRSLRVVSAGSARVGYANYCVSGRTSGEHCGYRVTSINAQACTASGCKRPVIAYTGDNLPRPGDSGAPFYVQTKGGSCPWSQGCAGIRGHHIAHDTATATGWAEPWTVVSTALGVSIATD